MGVKISFEQLCDEVSLPCIVHWNQCHFVVIYKIEKKKNETYVYISDPASGLLKYKKEQFLKCWAQIVSETSGKKTIGIALLLEPTPNFAQQKDEDSRLKFKNLLKYLYPYKRFIVQLFLAMLTGSIISLILPFLTQSVIDVGIGTSDLNFVIVVLIAQVVLVLGQMANELIRSWLMLHMTTRVSISLISDFLSVDNYWWRKGTKKILNLTKYRHYFHLQRLQPCKLMQTAISIKTNRSRHYFDNPNPNRQLQSLASIYVLQLQAGASQ